MRWPERSKAASGTNKISGTSSAAFDNGSRMPSGPRCNLSLEDQARNFSGRSRATITGDDGAGRKRKRQPALRERLRRSGPIRDAQAVARGEGCGAEGGFHLPEEG